MKNINLLIILFLFIGITVNGQNADTIKQQVADTIKKVTQQKNLVKRPGVKKDATKDAVKPPAEKKEAGQKPASEAKEAKKPVKEKAKEVEQENVEEETQEATKENVAEAQSNISEENATTFLVKIYDRNTMQTIDGVEVYLFEMPEGKFVDTNLSLNGIATFTIDKDTEYEVRACTEGYIKRGIGIFDCNSADKVFCLRGVFHFDYGPPETEENTLLAKIKMDPLAMGQTMELDNVYYDTGKSTLRPESKKELDRLYNLMKQYSTLKIEVSSHTDSRGGAQGNMNLSSNRAKACYTYLTRKGIAKDRIAYKGYGETRLLNECADGVNCNDKQHQVNRRTEISILEIEPEPCEPKL